MSTALLCGEGKFDHTPDGPKPFGCHTPIDGGMLVYRCADCDLAFHKGCLVLHFMGPGASSRPSCSEADRLRQEIDRVFLMLNQDDLPTPAELAALRELARQAEDYHVTCGHDDEGAAAQCDDICRAWKAWKAATPKRGTEKP